MRRSGYLALAACAVLALASTMAFAHTKGYSTSTSLQSPDGNIDTQEGSYFKGKVSSSKAACVKNRTIAWKFSDFFYAPVSGTTKTDASGNWRVDQEHAGSGYEMTVTVKAKRLVKNGQHKHTCKEVIRTDN